MFTFSNSGIHAGAFGTRRGAIARLRGAMPPAERFNTFESHPRTDGRRFRRDPVLHQHHPDCRLLPRAVLQLANRRHRLGLLGNRLRPVPHHRLRGMFHSPPIREIINAKAREAARPTRFSFPLLLYACCLAPLRQTPRRCAVCAALIATAYGGNLRLGHTLAPQSPNEPSSPLLAPTAPTSRRCARSRQWRQSAPEQRTARTRSSATAS